MTTIYIILLGMLAALSHCAKTEAIAKRERVGGGVREREGRGGEGESKGGK